MVSVSEKRIGDESIWYQRKWIIKFKKNDRETKSTSLILVAFLLLQVSISFLMVIPLMWKSNERCLKSGANPRKLVFVSKETRVSYWTLFSFYYNNNYYSTLTELSLIAQDKIPWRIIIYTSFPNIITPFYKVKKWWWLWWLDLCMANIKEKPGS